MRDWATGTRAGDWVSMAIPSRGDYGIREGLIYSFPVTVRDGAVSVVADLKPSAAVRSRMEASEAELLEELAAVEHLLPG